MQTNYLIFHMTLLTVYYQSLILSFQQVYLQLRLKEVWKKAINTFSGLLLCTTIGQMPFFINYNIVYYGNKMVSAFFKDKHLKDSGEVVF